MTTTEDRLAQLEAQQAAQSRILKLIIEGKWTGELPTAAAEIDALLGGGIKDFTPQPFPKASSGPVSPPHVVPLTVKAVPSPNFWTGRQSHTPIAVILHTMGGSLAGTDSWFSNPVSQVSAHYGIGLDGAIHQYVDLQDSAWGNGILEVGNTWPGPGNVSPNRLTVSVETEDLGNPNQPVTDAQFTSVLDVLLHVLTLYPSITWLLGHSVISPHSRAHCPGDRWVTSGRFATLAATLNLSTIGG